MSLAAIGCNPTFTGSNIEVGGLALGTEAFSHNAGKFVLLQAAEAITAFRMCVFAPGWQAEVGNAADDIGFSYGIGGLWSSWPRSRDSGNRERQGDGNGFSGG